MLATAPDDREMLNERINMPLDGEEPSEEVLEAEGAEFVATMKQLTGG